MALGKQLISNILSEDLTKTGIKNKKGAFTDERNYKIACRFYYHFTIKGLRYERSLELLHNEFNLCETRLAQLIMAGRDHLSKLKNDNTGSKELKEKFPYYNWN